VSICAEFIWLSIGSGGGGGIEPSGSTQGLLVSQGLCSVKLVSETWATVERHVIVTIVTDIMSLLASQ
jgi:hypothetical protein